MPFANLSLSPILNGILVFVYAFRQKWGRKSKKEIAKGRKICYTNRRCNVKNEYAGMAELADAQDLGSCIARCAGSTPVTRTISKDQL